MSVNSELFSKSLSGLCVHCLDTAIRITWLDETQGIDLETVNTLIANYRVILLSVCSTLKIDYSPDIAWLKVFGYLKELETINLIRDGLIK